MRVWVFLCALGFFLCALGVFLCALGVFVFLCALGFFVRRAGGGGRGTVVLKLFVDGFPLRGAGNGGCEICFDVSLPVFVDVFPLRGTVVARLFVDVFPLRGSGVGGCEIIC